MKIDIPVLLFSLCLLWIFWVIAGYPILLSWQARRLGRVAAGPPVEPFITAVVPVHNGGKFLAAKLDSILGSDYPPSRLDVLVLSDASSDDTDRIAESYGSTGRVRFVRLPRGGKPAALSAAFQLCEREILLLTDVRQILDPHCVRLLVARFHDPEVGVVSGNLKIRGGETSGEEGVGLYWRYESWIRRNLSQIDSLLGATGPIYAIRRSLARPLPKECLLDDMWLPLQIVLDGYRAPAAEDSVAWDYPTSPQSEFIRKVRTQAGIYQLLAMEPRLLKPWANRLWLSFVTLKLGRLFLPHVLIAIFLISFWLPAPMRTAVLIPQIAFYALSLLDRFIPETAKLKRISGPVSAIATLVMAAFCAQIIFFKGPANLWKTTHVRITEKRA